MDYRNTEFGRLSTTQEQVTYTLILEQRKTNELLQAILAQLPEKPAPIIEPEPVPEPEPIPDVSKPKKAGR